MGTMPTYRNTPMSKRRVWLGDEIISCGIQIKNTKSPKIKNYPTTNLYDLTNKHFNKREIENKLKLIFETNFSKMYKVNKN